MQWSAIGDITINEQTSLTINGCCGAAGWFLICVWSFGCDLTRKRRGRRVSHEEVFRGLEILTSSNFDGGHSHAVEILFFA